MLQRVKVMVEPLLRNLDVDASMQQWIRFRLWNLNHQENTSLSAT